MNDKQRIESAITMNVTPLAKGVVIELIGNPRPDGTAGPVTIHMTYTQAGSLLRALAGTFAKTLAIERDIT
jgi:hypothetical protein